MSKLNFFIVAIFAVLICPAVNAQETEWIAVDGINVSVNELIHDFGTQKLYTKTEFEFKIKNDSTATFAIQNISTSCGCTTPTYSKRPVKSGKTAVVKVAYDSARIGSFEKSIYVYTNYSTIPIELKIKGTMDESKTK